MAHNCQQQKHVHHPAVSPIIMAERRRSIMISLISAIYVGSFRVENDFNFLPPVQNASKIYFPIFSGRVTFCVNLLQRLRRLSWMIIKRILMATGQPPVHPSAQSLAKHSTNKRVSRPGHTSMPAMMLSNEAQKLAETSFVSCQPAVFPTSNPPSLPQRHYVGRRWDLF